MKLHCFDSKINRTYFEIRNIRKMYKVIIFRKLCVVGFSGTALEISKNVR